MMIPWRSALAASRPGSGDPPGAAATRARAPALAAFGIQDRRPS